jgi:hypothetical protein
MSREKIDVDNLTITGAKPSAGDGAPLTIAEDVIIVVNQAYGPTGESLIDDDVMFDGFPAIALLVRTEEGESLVYLSPIHGDRRKQGLEDLPSGTKCELLCPKSRQPLTKIGKIVEHGEAEYCAIYLTPRLDRGSMIYVSDVWGHLHSRVVDNNELISYWAAAEEEQYGATQPS